jgi:hypothetical protein
MSLRYTPWYVFFGGEIKYVEAFFCHGMTRGGDLSREAILQALKWMLGRVDVHKMDRWSQNVFELCQYMFFSWEIKSVDAFLLQSNDQGKFTKRSMESMFKLLLLAISNWLSNHQRSNLRKDWWMPNCAKSNLRRKTLLTLKSSFAAASTISKHWLPKRDWWMPTL